MKLAIALPVALLLLQFVHPSETNGSDEHNSGTVMPENWHKTYPLSPGKTFVFHLSHYRRLRVTATLPVNFASNRCVSSNTLQYTCDDGGDAAVVDVREMGSGGQLNSLTFDLSLKK